MRVADALANRLAEAGVRQVFGIPGGEVLALIDACDRAGIEYVTARHETAAGLMAEGASAATGAPGLLLVTLGPGVSNAVNAIANAALDRVPLIVVTGAPAVRGPTYTHQVFDQRALLAPLVKASFVASARTIDEDMCAAIAFALQHPRGPVQIEVPQDVAIEPAESGTMTPVHHVRSGFEAESTSVASDDVFRAAADWLTRSTKPLVLAGLEAATSDVAGVLGALLERIDAPLLTTYKGKGVVDEQAARSIGAVALSPSADAIALPLIRAADFVLLVGYDPIEMRAPYSHPFAPDARIVEIAAGARTHDMHHASVTWTGDIASGIESLMLALGSSELQPHWPDREPARVRAELREAFAPARAPGFSPLAVSHTLSRCIPAHVRVTVDTGAHRIALSQVFEAQRPGQLLQSNGLCTMGYALPCAIGVARASGQPVVAVMGDGGLEMVLGELATLRDLALPVTIVVFDDRSLALIDLKQRAHRYAERGVMLGPTDHVALAEAFGGEGIRISETAALEAALARALSKAEGFTLISCALEPRAYDGWL